MSTWASVRGAYEFLASRSRFGIRPGLSRMQALCEVLGHPERQLQFLHVAGTNGKGSVCAMLTALFQEQGLRIGLYTSPDLGKLEERIRINQKQISDQEFAQILWDVKTGMETLPADPELEPTEFEVLTAVALLYFASEQVDLVIWETGLGGRFDATNIVTPLVSVITNVGLDHEQILGDTIPQIAFDKAGIIKAEVPVVTAAAGAALSVVKDVATALHSPLYSYPKDFRVVRLAPGTWQGQTIAYFGLWRDDYGLRLSLPGEYQLQNAVVALAAFEVVQQQWGNHAGISMRGVQKARWPGRMEVLRSEPVRVIVDGAHNVHAVKELAVSLMALGERRLILVFGALADKRIADMLRYLLHFACEVWITKPNNARAETPQTIKELVQVIGDKDLPVQIAPAVSQAVSGALASAQRYAEPVSVLVTGSLYTVAEARGYLGRDQGLERNRG